MGQGVGQVMNTPWEVHFNLKTGRGHLRGVKRYDWMYPETAEEEEN